MKPIYTTGNVCSAYKYCVNKQKELSMPAKKKTAVAISLILGLGIGVVHAAPITTTGNNFTLLDSINGFTGGTNDVTFTWDGTYNTNPATAVSNATLSSITPFFSSNWAAYDIKVYGPGSYTLSSDDTLGSAGCPYIANCMTGGGNYNVTVGPDQVMAHMKFAWSSSQGIDVVNIWDYQQMSSRIYAGMIDTDGDGIPDRNVGGNPSTAWDGMSTDWNGDGINGGGMIDGPFVGFNANFNVMGVHPIPVPAAAWLFGSGLMGLVGAVWRRKKV